MKRALIGLMGLLLAAACYADSAIDERAAADPQGKVTISNISGSISVSGWNNDEITVQGTLGNGAERLEFVPSGDHTLIKVVVPRNAHNVADTDLVIKVPLNSQLKIDAVSADIDVREVQGSQRLQAVSGDIDMQVFGEDVEARTVSGDLTVVGQKLPLVLTLTAVSGDLDIRDVGGELIASAVSGDLDIVAGSMKRLKASTTNGDIDIAMTLDPAARVDIKTINGSVGLELGGNLDAQYDIETFNGRIRNCFGPDAQRTSKYAPGRELRFDEGDSDARIRIKTLNGAIEVCDR